MNIKYLLLKLIHLTEKNLFCIIRNFLELIFFRQKFSLKYSKPFYVRKYDEFTNIYFPNKFRSIMYGRGYKFRLNSLAKSYFLNRIKFNEGDTIIDCGANIGEIFLYFQLKKIKITYYAFEPAENEFICLKKNTNQENLYKKALWKQNTNLPFFIKSNTADSTVFKIEDYEKKTFVEATKLDSLNLESIKLLKIEAEGAEPEVLQGSIQTIRKCNYIVVDSGKERGRNFEETTMSVCNLLIKNNFDLIYIDHIRIVLMFRNAMKEEI